MEKQIIVYEQRADIRLDVKTDGETVWLTQEQMCRLFGRERSVITKHIRNMVKEGELAEEVVRCQEECKHKRFGRKGA